MLMNDRNFIIEAMKISGENLKYLDDKYKDDLETINNSIDKIPIPYTAVIGP